MPTGSYKRLPWMGNVKVTPDMRKFILSMLNSEPRAAT